MVGSVIRSCSAPLTGTLRLRAYARARPVAMAADVALRGASPRARRAHATLRHQLRGAAHEKADARHEDVLLRDTHEAVVPACRRVRQVRWPAGRMRTRSLAGGMHACARDACSGGARIQCDDEALVAVEQLVRLCGCGSRSRSGFG